MNKDINRLKVVLAEKKRTNKWLAEELSKDPATVSKWCTNTLQPHYWQMILQYVIPVSSAHVGMDLT